jgi:hypothetical protein
MRTPAAVATALATAAGGSRFGDSPHPFRDFKDLSEEDTWKIVHDNWAKLYGFEV